MKVCLISNQIAAWGKIGGFGTATRALGAGLFDQGIDVSAVIPIRKSGGQENFEQLDGISVYGMSAWNTLVSGEVFKRINADVYHSQEPTIASYHAMKAKPDAIHIITCRDPRNFHDRLVELRYSNLQRLLLSPINTWLYEASTWVKKAVKNANLVLSPAPSYLDYKIRQIYGNEINPIFTPSPVNIPNKRVTKSEQPLILFVGRWDRRKRIELFFELARNNPDKRFVAIGRSHDKNYDAFLRKSFGDIPNVEMPGFISTFDSPGIDQFYEKAWILVNTSAREGLPYTFIESLAHECAILSCLDPEKFTSRFGYYADHDEFQEGLDWLLDEERYIQLGKAGAKYVRGIFNKENSIRQHLMHYRRLTGTDNG